MYMAISYQNFQNHEIKTRGNQQCAMPKKSIKIKCIIFWLGVEIVNKRWKEVQRRCTLYPPRNYILKFKWEIKSRKEWKSRLPNAITIQSYKDPMNIDFSKVKLDIIEIVVIPVLPKHLHNKKRYSPPNLTSLMAIYLFNMPELPQPS